MVRRNPGFIAKKPHRKSRGRCQTCKSKKVKCDESRPACGYCKLRKLDCEYLQDSALQSPESSSLCKPLATESPANDFDFSNPTLQSFTWLIPASNTATGQLTTLEYELLDHYKSSAWRLSVMREDPLIYRLHKDIVPQMSISNSYLLYTLLSIAATHRNALYPSKQLEALGLEYRQKTFQAYGQALKTITNDNYESVLATGTLLIMLLPQPGPHASDAEYLDWTDSLLQLMGGIRILAGLRWDHGIEKLTVYPLIRRELRSLPPPPIIDVPNTPLIQSGIGALGTTPNHPNPAPTYDIPYTLPFASLVFLPPSLMVILESLTSPKEAGPIDLDRNKLVPVFYVLSPIFLSLYYYHLNPDFYVRVFVFSSFLMPEFLALVKAREPRALLILGWWYAIADLLPHGYMVKSNVGSVVKAIGRVIERSGNAGIIEAYEGALRLVRVFDTIGREQAAVSVFDEWPGVMWDDGPRKAEEWERGLCVDLDDAAAFANTDLEIST